MAKQDIMKSEFALTAADLSKFNTWNEGFNAYDEDKCLNDNPYQHHNQRRTWEDGWWAAWKVEQLGQTLEFPIHVSHLKAAA